VFGTIIVAALLTGLVSGVLTAPFGDNYAARGIVAAIASAIPECPTWPWWELPCAERYPGPAADGELGAARRHVLAPLNDGGLLAALLDVRLDELLGVLFEDSVDLVEEVVQLALEVLGVHAALDRRIRGGLGPGAMMALRPFVNSFHVHRPLPGCIGTDGGRLNGTW
jgi:hypothetical protein